MEFRPHPGVRPGGGEPRELKARSVARVAAWLGGGAGTLGRWRQVLAAEGVLGLAPEKPGPKGPSRLTEPKMSEIRALLATGLSMRAI